MSTTVPRIPIFADPSAVSSISVLSIVKVVVLPVGSSTDAVIPEGSVEVAVPPSATGIISIKVP